MSDTALCESTRCRLELNHNIANQVVTLVFQFRENASAEKDLGDTHTVEGLVHTQLLEDHLRDKLAFEIALGYVFAQHFVALPEFDESQAIGESGTRNANAFKYTVTS